MGIFFLTFSRYDIRVSLRGLQQQIIDNCNNDTVSSGGGGGLCRRATRRLLKTNNCNYAANVVIVDAEIGVKYINLRITYPTRIFDPTIRPCLGGVWPI